MNYPNSTNPIQVGDIVRYASHRTDLIQAYTQDTGRPFQGKVTEVIDYSNVAHCRNIAVVVVGDREGRDHRILHSNLKFVVGKS
jgi:hypothetical protein